MSRAAFLLDGVRTPFGRYGGALADVRPDDLLAGAIAALVARTQIEPAAIEDVIAGCVCQSAEDARNVARHGALLAGLPASVPGVTINRLCGSSLAAALDAARVVGAGQGAMVVAGGVESMSRAPLVIGKARSAFARDQRLVDATAGIPFPNPQLIARYGADTMPQTAENVARDQGLTRAMCDRFAARSQSRYAAALAEGFFDGEIVPVDVIGPKGAVVRVCADEHPRPASTGDSLAKLAPLQAGGVVTAGNASGINDGAAALLIGDEAVAAGFAAPPLARIVSGAVTGIEPRIMGLGPVQAIARALDRAGIRLEHVDVIEINEAFAAQVLGCLKLLGIAQDDARVNPGGGAIAIGHPLGASGARVLLTAARRLQRTNGRYAVAAMCIGIGQGIAAVIERS